jgi:hypothetical protein
MLIRLSRLKRSFWDFKHRHSQATATSGRLRLNIHHHDRVKAILTRTKKFHMICELQK